MAPFESQSTEFNQFMERLRPLLDAAAGDALAQAPPPDPLLSARSVAEHLEMHHKTVLEWGRTGGPDGTFPAPVAIPGTRLVRWRLSQIEAWLAGETPTRRLHAA